MAITTILVEDDETKLSKWSAYLSEYDRETSKKPEWDMAGLGTPKRATGKTMEQVLEFLAGTPTGSGSNGLRVGLIYAHASRSGLIMRLTKDSNSASSKFVRGVSRAWKAIFEIIPLRSSIEIIDEVTGRPDAKPGTEEWRKTPGRFTIDVPRAQNLFNRLIADLRALQGSGQSYDKLLADPSTIKNRDQADAWFDQWMGLMAKACLGGGLGETDLRRLCRAMQKVRDQRFDRIEIRGCNIGKDPENLNALKEFFGTPVVIAPKNTMFFGNNGVNSNMTGFDLLEKGLGGWKGLTFITPSTKGMIPNEVKQVQKMRTIINPDTNKLIPEVFSGHRNRIFTTTAGDVVMLETETAADSFEFNGALWAPSDAAVTQFARMNFKSTYTYTAGTRKLPVGGMYTPDATLPFALPLEADYRSLLETSN